MGSLVFCDIEGTLVDGNIARGFIREGRARRLFSTWRMLTAQGYIVAGRVLPRQSADLRWRALLSLMAGLDREAIRQAGIAGLADLHERLKPATLARLRGHQAQGDRVVLLSGSLQDAASAIAAAVGADAGEGTQPEIHAGRYTGRMGNAPINQGPAKAARAVALAEAHGIPLGECTAYGDSAADIPLLSAVGHPVAVDPDAGLREVAEARGWEILWNGKD
jgi:HAD superfamily hydrolase (TIGR01490 family)